MKEAIIQVMDQSIEYVITDHAWYEMDRRGISTETVEQILDAPEQRVPVHKGRDVFQSRVNMEGRKYLVRIFVDIDRKPNAVVTVYRTRKIRKYWRELP